MEIFEGIASTYTIPEEKKSDTDKAQEVYNTLINHPLIHSINAELENGKYALHVHTKPIWLKNPRNEEQKINLGCLRIKLYSTGGITIYRSDVMSAEESGRDAQTTERNPHPHVSAGSVCFGNIRNLIYTLNEAKNLSMLITVIIEYLQTYNPGDAYWRPDFKFPCIECKALGKRDCTWCSCSVCTSKNSHGACPGCEGWRVQSAGVACMDVKAQIDVQFKKIDEDDFINLMQVIIKEIKK